MTRFERWSVIATSAATGLTGLGYLWVKYAMESTDPFSIVNHPIQPWLLKSHILVAPLLVFAVGMIAVRHIWRHFRSGMLWGRRSGITTALVLGPMVATGYLIQSVTDELWLRAMALSHIGTSIAFLLGLTVHALILARILDRSRVRGRPATPPATLARTRPRRSTLARR